MTDQLYRAATDKEIIALAYVSLAVVPVEIDYEAAEAWVRADTGKILDYPLSQDDRRIIRGSINAALGIGGDDEKGQA